MKLFLTAKSERGKPITKSGNDWLEIEVLNEKRQVIFKKTFKQGKDHLKLEALSDNPCYCDCGMSVPHYH